MGDKFDYVALSFSRFVGAAFSRDRKGRTDRLFLNRGCPRRARPSRKPLLQSNSITCSFRITGKNRPYKAKSRTITGSAFIFLIDLLLIKIYDFNLFLPKPARPINPVPKSSMVAGSGTGVVPPPFSGAIVPLPSSEPIPCTRVAARYVPLPFVAVLKKLKESTDIGES